MTVHLSPVFRATESTLGGNFSVHRPDSDLLAEHAAPIMGFDDYRMGGPTFPPHPHAGFSVVTYVYEDSPGAVRNRDSLGHDMRVRPGGLLWTQAGSGLIHDEVPAEPDRPVHGLQLFVNLGSANKHRSPEVFHVEPEDVPVVTDAAGNRIRVLTGTLDTTAALRLAEAFDFYDATLRAPWRLPVLAGRNLMVYVLSGVVKVGSGDRSRVLQAHEALAAHGTADDVIDFEPQGDARMLLLSGTDPSEPVAAHGPFIMNTKDELLDAYERYRKGHMGRLAA